MTGGCYLGELGSNLFLRACQYLYKGREHKNSKKFPSAMAKQMSLWLSINLETFSMDSSHETKIFELFPICFGLFICLSVEHCCCEQCRVILSCTYNTCEVMLGWIGYYLALMGR